MKTVNGMAGVLAAWSRSALYGSALNLLAVATWLLTGQQFAF